MAYFNHAFKMVFLGTHQTAAEAFVGGAGTALTQAGIDTGFVTSTYTTNGGTGGGRRLTTADLQSFGMGVGSFAFFAKDTYQIVNTADLSGRRCCPLILASASLILTDKLNPFAGGYQESTKSKYINPKYIQKVYKVESCTPQQSVTSIGTTPYTKQTVGVVATVNTLVGGTGYVTATTYATTGGSGTGATLTVTVGGAAASAIDAVATASLSAGGTGYVNGTYFSIGGTGTGASFACTGNGNILSAIGSVATGGTGYTVGDVLVLAGGNANATVTVATVSTTGGVITAVAISDAGTGYSVGDVLTIVGGQDDSTVTVATITAMIGADTACCFNFLCGETYYLRVDVKGSPVLRTLNHQAYQNIPAYTGCCSGIVPTNVDPTLVYLEWAKEIVRNNYLKDFVAPVVYDYTGVAWYAPGTTVTMDGTSTAVTSAQWWESAAGVDQYAASVQAAAWTTECTAGMRLFGAFVETQFNSCSFQMTDFFEKEPVQIYASLVDYNGDPCRFEGICVYREECTGLQGMGFGEQVLRDLIQSEAYLQNFVKTNTRLREVTHGTDIINSVNRNSMYTRYCILHSVPRFANPSGLSDNDRYLLEIITTGTSASLETFLSTWLSDCADCATLETLSCTVCDIVPDTAI